MFDLHAAVDGHVAGHAEICRVDNLIGRGVVEDGLGVDAGLVGESAEATKPQSVSAISF
jgi:hypothetical protein